MAPRDTKIYESVLIIEANYKIAMQLLEDSTRIMNNLNLKIDNILLKHQLQQNKQWLLKHGRRLDE